MQITKNGKYPSSVSFDEHVIEMYKNKRFAGLSLQGDLMETDEPRLLCLFRHAEPVQQGSVGGTFRQRLQRRFKHLAAARRKLGRLHSKGRAATWAAGGEAHAPEGTLRSEEGALCADHRQQSRSPDSSQHS